MNKNTTTYRLPNCQLDEFFTCLCSILDQISNRSRLLY